MIPADSERTQLTVDNSCNLRHVLWSSMHLSVGEGDLKCPANSEANDDLVTNPLASRSLRVHSVEEPTTNCCQCTTDYPEDRYDAYFDQCNALYYGGDRQRYDQCKHSNTRSNRTAVVYTLKVDRKIVEYGEICATEEEHEAGAHENIALREL
jgi:hypothetical protein